MKKYYAVAKTEWHRQSVYKLSQLGFRISSFIEITIQIIIWTIIFKSVENVYGYNYSEMITYIVIGYLFAFLTANYGYETNIAKMIQTGEISNLICKPVNLLLYIISVSFGRLYVTFFTSLLTQFIFIVSLNQLIIVPNNLIALLLVALMVFTGYFIKLFLSIMIGMIAFWTNSISGFQYSAKVFINFFSGAFFTLTLLPASILKITMSLPFAYTFFVPTQVYLGKMSIEQGIKGLIISLVWLIILFIIIKIIWAKGMKKYEGVGI